MHLASHPATHHVSRISTITAAATLLLALGGGVAAAIDTPTDPGELTVIDTSEGKALADENGNALYAWAGDTKNTSHCTGACATAWPAATGSPTKSADVTGETGRIDLAGSDGKKQVVLEGKPLYYFKDDAKPGDTKGNGVKAPNGKVWGLVAPDGKLLGVAAGAPVPDASASTATSTGTDTSTAKPTGPGGMKATPSGAVEAGAETAEPGSSTGIASAVGGAVALAAVGTAFAVRRRRTGGDHS